VRAHDEGGIHRSTFVWVDDASYPGPDGTWLCAERGFDPFLAAAAGGVIFAQSTGTVSDEHAFPRGVAFEVPAHARIIGDVHLLNSESMAGTTRIGFEIDTLPPAEVTVQLQPMAFSNTTLDIPAGSMTRARMQCVTGQSDFEIYYVLPHFHSTGVEIRVGAVGGPMDGQNLWSARGGYGEVLGEMLDPPITVQDALGLEITCDYHNTTGDRLSYGPAEEMCIALMYATGNKGSWLTSGFVHIADIGELHDTQAACHSAVAP